MNKKRLSLYLDNICNLKCSYCNVDYSKKRTFSDQDLLEWFEKNKEMIDMRQIKLCGGEPTLIYLSLFDFLEQFESIFMITNLYDRTIIDKWIKQFGRKIKFTVSFHDEYIDVQLENIIRYLKNIDMINIVITFDNIISNIEYLDKIKNKIDNKKIMINLLPKLPNSSIDSSNLNYQKIEVDLLKMVNYINNEKTFILVNEEIINKMILNSKKCDFNKKISIFLDGKIDSCVCNSPFYSSFIDYSSFKNNKYEDCEKCKKCFLYVCNQGFINNDYDYREFCFLSKTLYDIIIYKKGVDDNVK